VSRQGGEIRCHLEVEPVRGIWVPEPAGAQGEAAAIGAAGPEEGRAPVRQDFASVLCAGQKIAHQTGVSCQLVNCPKCGAKMVRE